MFQHGAVPHIVFNNENFERLVVLHISDYIGFYLEYNAKSGGIIFRIQESFQVLKDFYY
jgi:hypothetical protein